MDTKDIDKRLNGVSPAPWSWATSNSWKRLEDGNRRLVVEPHIARADGHPNLTVSDEDMEFIAHAREDVPALLAALRLEKQRADRWQALVENRILAGLQVLLAGGYSDMSAPEILDDLQMAIIHAGGEKGPPPTPREDWEAKALPLPGVEL